MVSLQEWVGLNKRTNPFLAFILKIVSRHPLNDIGITNWFGALIGSYVFGFEQFWIVTINLIALHGVQLTLKAETPEQADDRIVPRATSRRPSG